MKRVAIIQPNYVPWKGYFDIIASVDCFVFLDDVQHTIRDWRTRNKIKTLDGSSVWLSVPTLGGRSQLIREVKIDYSQNWAHRHLESIRHSYVKTPHFHSYFPRLSELLETPWPFLADFNIALTGQLMSWLGISCETRRSSELNSQGTKDLRLLSLIRAVGGTAYLSGPSARDYIRPENFADAGIDLSYHDYGGYPEYPQISAPFDHFVTVLDLLFAVGSDAPEYIWGKRRDRTKTT